MALAEEMPKNYDPAVNEPAILQKWLDGGYYKRACVAYL